MGEESGKVQTPLRSLEEHDERVRREDIRAPGDTNPQGVFNADRCALIHIRCVFNDVRLYRGVCNVMHPY